MPDTHTRTVKEFFFSWLEALKENKSRNTYLTALAASREFIKIIGDIPLDELDEEQYSIFLSRLKQHSPATEKLYATMIYLFFEYLAHKNLKGINTANLRYLRRNETRKVGRRLRELDKDLLSQLRKFVLNLETNDLTLLRAKAWITLAFESGLRVFEICGLRRNDLNLSGHFGIVTGKGDKQAKFYFSSESVAAISEYLEQRQRREPSRGSNIPAENRPLFVSHSKRSSRHLSPIDTETARADLKRVAGMMSEGDRITPHLIRHFFVNAILEETGNPETARKAARHDSIATTQRYLHVDDEEVQEAHKKIFGE